MQTDNPGAWLQLLHVRGMRVADKRACVNHLATPEALFALDSRAAAELLRVQPGEARRMLQSGEARAAEDLAVMQKLDMRFVPFCSPDFPPLLNQISSPPLGLFVRGKASLLSAPQLAMVGSRSPTPSGRRTAEAFAADLSRAGLAITSGLAFGIDSAAHRGCLDAGGKTLAVVATGLDQMYPKRNQPLADEIIAKGALVSEFAPGTPPKREFFPQRNRLISGLSLGVLVVEAGVRSGSLITARLAGEHGREVFAVPGSIHVPTSRGCHYLIRNGAKLVETTQDVTSEIGGEFTAPATPKKKPADPALAREVFDLFARIDFAPVSVDDLIAQSGLSADEVSYILTTLEMKGLVAATAAGYQRLPQAS